MKILEVLFSVLALAAFLLGAYGLATTFPIFDVVLNGIVSAMLLGLLGMAFLSAYLAVRSLRR